MFLSGPYVHLPQQLDVELREGPEGVVITGKQYCGIEFIDT